MTSPGNIASASCARSVATWALLGLLLAAAPTRAEPDCDALRGDEAILPGDLLPGTGNQWKAMQLPDRGDVDDALLALDADTPLVYRVDLNRDSLPELLLASPGGKLCGNGGCPYELLDPKTLKRIGSFFGHGLALLDERINGYRIIQTWERYRGSATSLNTYVFNGRHYRLVAHVIVEECGLAQWERHMRRDNLSDR